jgi:uncharacterized membrane protein YraQ (UPF0718 family)
MSLINDFFSNTWSLVAEMAPYLLFGFAVAGLLHVLIQRDFVERWLGKPGLSSVVKASVLGTPMPLCSCSVIPVAASLRRSGATRGATASFLSSTPQTGVDSILATYALLGGVFTLVRVFVAFVCGIVTGYLIELFCEDKRQPEQPSDSPDFSELSFHLRTEAISLSPKPSAERTRSSGQSCCSEHPKPTAIEAARYGFVTLPADLASALLVGLLLAGLITTLMPNDLLTGSFSSGPLAFLLATAISLPLYVCATASIPMAYALMAAGLSPGAALVFLITGPATNTATVATVWKMLGRSATAIYLLSLLLVSWLAGWLFNSTLASEVTAAAHNHEAMEQLSLWQQASALVLVGLLLFSVWKTRQSKQGSCCSGK